MSPIVPNRSSIVKHYFLSAQARVYYALTRREMYMTVCVATLCDEGRGVVLVSDKKVGKGYVEGEPEISKLQMIHPHWFMMMSGDDISPLFDLADLVRKELTQAHASLEDVAESMQRNYELIRARRAEATYLKPLGWTLERFTKEGGLLPNYDVVQARVRDYELPVDILVAGFDRTLTPPGKIFTMSPETRGIPIRHDIPGFATIGTGGVGAEYMLFYRDVSLKLPMRAAVYYALEAKYFGEFASGVGERTDMFAIRFDGAMTHIAQIRDAQTIEKKLIPICHRLTPQDPENRDIDVLNSISELAGLP
jgi:hypothetical protein